MTVLLIRQALGLGGTKGPMSMTRLLCCRLPRSESWLHLRTFQEWGVLRQCWMLQRGDFQYCYKYHQWFCTGTRSENYSLELWLCEVLHIHFLATCVQSHLSWAMCLAYERVLQPTIGPLLQHCSVWLEAVLLHLISDSFFSAVWTIFSYLSAASPRAFASGVGLLKNLAISWELVYLPSFSFWVWTRFFLASSSALKSAFTSRMVWTMAFLRSERQEW